MLPPQPSRVLLAVLLVSLFAACAAPARSRPNDADWTSSTLSPFVYYDEGELMMIAVDTRAATMARGDRLFALGVAVANNDRKALTVDRESFALEDESGRRYPLASYEEYREGYKRSRSDARLQDLFIETLSTRRSIYRQRQLGFFPNTASLNRLAVDEKEIAGREMAIGLLYFPIPEGGLKGQRFGLLVKTREHGETFLVRFRVK